jgi:hypothetical protein
MPFDKQELKLSMELNQRDHLKSFWTTMVLTLDKKKVDAIDLSALKPFVTDDETKQYFDQPTGEEHYRLLGYLSTCFNNTTLYDIGTCFGGSAVALSYNPSNKIVSYDIVDRQHGISHPNIEFRIGDCLKELTEIIQSPFILLDTYHDGEFERVFYKALVDAEYKGILLLDDTELNDEMKSFWESIKLTKYSIKYFGHWSGTGIVFFGSQKIEFQID